MYSNIRARAGLVALFFALIISLVSAVPIPIHTDLVQRGTGGLAQIPLNSPISTPPVTTRVLTGDNISVDEDNHLVRRNARINAKIRTGFKKLGNGIKHAAQKVGTFMKHTGAAIVKVGLKIASTVVKAASKVIGFIPGIGKPLGKIMGAASKVAGMVSDKIHAHLGKKLEKAMSGMNKANKIMKYIPRDLSEEEDFWY